MIARNLLNGFGFVDAPLDPPALWRPPLAVALLVPIEVFVRDPRLIYQIFGTLTLVGFLVSVFYLMKTLGGTVAAHFSPLIVLATPAFTSLVGHQLQLLSYLLHFSLVTLSILTTLWSWLRSDWRRDVAVGLCWGVAFLARPETIILFTVSLISGLVFRRSLGVAGKRAALSFVCQLAAFLAVYEPAVLTFRSAQKHYNLLGQEPLFTYYAGAHFASNQLTGDVDGDGYLETVARFGSPEKYRNSMVQFVMAHPAAISARIRQNLSNFKRLAESRFIVNFWDCLGFLVFSSILVIAKPPPIPAKPLLAYMTLLLFASPYFLVFHVDARYPLLFVVVLVLWILVVSLIAWTSIGSRVRLPWAGKWLPAFGLVLLCAFRLGHAIGTAQEGQVDIVRWQKLATTFRSIVRTEGTPVVGFVAPDGTTTFGGDFYWFSYFARTALPWCGSPDCDSGNAFPRSRIYSFLGKYQEFLWIPDERVSTVAGPSRVIVQHVRMRGMGRYTLLKVGANAPIDEEAIDVWAARRISEDPEGGYMARFVETPRVDKVSCAPLGLSPDGNADGLVEVRVPAPDRAWSIFGVRPNLVYLQRSSPPGTYATAKTTYILGVSKTPNGPLVNAADGSVAIGTESQFYLHYCRDGFDAADSTYQVVIGNNTIIPVKK